MRAGKINFVMDGQWGSTGKGKLAGYLAITRKVDASVCNFLTNAGHWFRSRVLGDFLVQQLPMAAINPKTRLYICAGSGITVPVLKREIEQFESRGINIRDRLIIDPNAFIISTSHVEKEKYGHMLSISSTHKGCGAALADKIQRNGKVQMVGDSTEIREFCQVAPVAPILKVLLDEGATVMGELAQGFDLSLNHGWRYPYVTSRDVTPMAFLADVGLPFKYAGRVYGALRTYPIRVGNVLDASGNMVEFSGPHYSDQVETSWADISGAIGQEVLERTTVTNKVRRVFTFSFQQLRRFTDYCAPSQLFLNFCNYFPGVVPGSGIEDILKSECGELARAIEAVSHVPIAFYGTGGDNTEMVDLLL